MQKAERSRAFARGATNLLYDNIFLTSLVDLKGFRWIRITEFFDHVYVHVTRTFCIFIHLPRIVHWKGITRKRDEIGYRLLHENGVMIEVRGIIKVTDPILGIFVYTVYFC